MRPLLAVLALGLGLLAPGALFTVGLTAHAEEAAKALDAKARVLRRSELRSAAGRWVTHRMRFPSRCPACQGAGAIPWSDAGRPTTIPCLQCKARKAWISTADYKAVYYDMRTEAFRRLPGIEDALERQYKEANAGQPWPTRFKRYSIRDWELVDETHGIVWFRFDGAKSPTATYWIWSTGAKPKGEWCLYDDRSDGAWPAVPDASSGTGPGKPWEVVGPQRLEGVRRAAAGASTLFWAAEFLEQGDALRVGLNLRDASPLLDPVAFIAGDALALLPPLFASSATWTRVETEWRTWWRDVDGILRLKPTWSMSLDRATFEAQGWTNLRPAQQLELLVWKPWRHEGWTAVRPGGLAPAPTPPPTPVEPAPSPEAPAPPTPTPEAPVPPDTVPPDSVPPVAPPPPAPPPPTEPERPATGPLPTLTSSARKAAEAGLARMRELLTLAQTAHNEGVQAHKSGSNDLWQEKINEASAHIGELEDVWTSQVLEAMPGRDEGQREELAIEHFGAIWDDVYALKSILRKTRAMR